MAETALIDTGFPNGLRLFCLRSSRSEAKFIYHEIFENETYVQHGVSIKDGDCIIDVGANVGMFSLFAMTSYSDLRILSFEPAPPTFEALRANIERCRPEVSGTIKMFPAGLADENSFRDLTFYPRAPGNSTLYDAEKQQEPEATADTISLSVVWNCDKLAFLGLMLLYPFRRSLIRSTLRKLYRNGKKYRCEFLTLSYIIEEQCIDLIDLLKIDVEGSEFDVLAGIHEEHWERIQQIVIEIAPSNAGRIDQLTDDLAQRGFCNIHLQSMGSDTYREGIDIPCTLYAARNIEPEAARSANEVQTAVHVPAIR